MCFKTCTKNLNDNLHKLCIVSHPRHTCCITAHLYYLENYLCVCACVCVWACVCVYVCFSVGVWVRAIVRFESVTVDACCGVCVCWGARVRGECVCVCGGACMHACMHACVRACVRQVYEHYKLISIFLFNLLHHVYIKCDTERINTSKHCIFSNAMHT